MAFQTDESIELATSVVIGTRYAKEMRKWDTPRSQGGFRPDGKEEYPQMVYKARKVNGQNVCLMNEPLREAHQTDEHWRREQELAERFNRNACRIVNNEQEYEAARRDGWRESPTDAIAFLDGLDNDIAVAAAHRHHEDKKLSPKAQEEALAADRASYEHLPEIPEQPKKRRGRPPKNAAA